MNEEIIDNGVLEALLREIIDRRIGLDLAAKILWQLRRYMEYRKEEKYVASAGSTEEALDCHSKTHHARLQLEHYLLLGGIESVKIDRLDSLLC